MLSNPGVLSLSFEILIQSMLLYILFVSPIDFNSDNNKKYKVYPIFIAIKKNTQVLQLNIHCQISFPNSIICGKLARLKAQLGLTFYIK